MTQPTMQTAAIGQLWFRNAAQYTEYMTLFEDAHTLPKTFSRWQKLATHAREDILRSGKVAIQVYATPDEFAAFCLSKKIRLDSAARSDFAAFKAYEKFTQAHPSKTDD